MSGWWNINASTLWTTAAARTLSALAGCLLAGPALLLPPAHSSEPLERPQPRPCPEYTRAERADGGRVFHTLPGACRVEEPHAIRHPTQLYSCTRPAAPAAIVCSASKRGARRVFTSPRCSACCVRSLSREWLTTWLACLLAGGDTAGNRCYWVDCLTHLHPRGHSWKYRRLVCRCTLTIIIPQYLHLCILYLVLVPFLHQHPGRSPDLHCSSPVKLGRMQRPNGPNL